MLNKIRHLRNSIPNAGITIEDSIQEQKKIRILNRATFNGSLILFSYTLFLLFIPFWELAIINLTFGLTTLLVYILSCYRKFNLARTIAFILFPILLLIFPYAVGRIGAEYYMILLLIMGFYIIDNKKLILGLSIYVIFLFILAKYFVLTRTYPAAYRLTETEFYYVNLALFLILLIMISLVFKFDSIAYQSTIENQSKNLSVKVTELEQSNSMYEQLLHELNHRIKNNLQLISSLFSMQLHNHKTKEIKQALFEAQQRIDSISILHHHLYGANNALNPNIKNYIDELIEHLKLACGCDYNLSTQIEIDEICLPIEKSVHIGLIINELFTNSIKYAINPDSLTNLITLSIQQKNNEIHISYSDNGPGLPVDFNLEKSNTLGLLLVSEIIQKYNGTISISNDNGASIFLILK